MHITKLSDKERGFITYLSSSNKSRTMELSIALGYSLAKNLTLPSSPVEDLILFFKTQHKIPVSNTLGILNEMCILDRDLVLEYTHKFYQLRYNAAYPSNGMLALNKETALEDFFGISKVLDKNTINCIEENVVLLTEFINNFSSILETLKSENTEF